MKKWRLILIIGVLLVPALIYALREYNRTNDDTADLKASIEIDALSLLKDYETDEGYANKEYNGKVISVTGRIIKIEDIGDTKKVILGDGISMNGVICEFQNSENEKAKGLVPTQEVKIKGICTGILLDVVLIRCVLE